MSLSELSAIDPQLAINRLLSPRQPAPAAQDIEIAMAFLRAARNHLNRAQAFRAAAKVRRALKSADGARRHALLAPFRRQRQQKARA